VATVATPRLLTKQDRGDPGSETAQEGAEVSPQVSSPAEGLMEPVLPEPLVDSIPKSEIDVLPTSDEDPEDAASCYHEGGDLFAEDVEQHMAVLPEVTTPTDEETIEDIQVGDPGYNTPQEIEKLRHIIWRKRHLLMGKGNALPPAAHGAICDIDVGGATRSRKGAVQSPRDIERSCPISSKACCLRR